MRGPPPVEWEGPTTLILVSLAAVMLLIVWGTTLNVLGCLLCGNICIAIYQFMQPRGGASAHPAKVTLCTFAVFFLRTMPHLLMSSRTMNFIGLLTSLSNFLICSQRRTWSSFAEAYDATARDFEICCPKYTLANIIQWHVSYEGNKVLQ